MIWLFLNMVFFLNESFAQTTLVYSTSLDGHAIRMRCNGKDNYGNHLSSGVYIYSLIAISSESNKEFQQTRKMVLLK